MRWQTRSYVEDYSSIDVQRWHREGLLDHSEFSCAWWRGDQKAASIGVRAEGTQVTLAYRYKRWGSEWQDVEQIVPLDWTDCHFGGQRPWFTCAARSNGVGCGRRVAKLYVAGGVFACRHCYRLHYTSQSENHMNRQLRKAQKIRTRLGGSGSLLDPLPPRPKGMHWRTYARMRDKAASTEFAMWGATAAWLDDLQENRPLRYASR